MTAEQAIAASPTHDRTSNPPRPAQGRPGQTSVAQPLLDPLSERELEVLQLVAGGASNQEIAHDLLRQRQYQESQLQQSEDILPPISAKPCKPTSKKAHYATYLLCRVHRSISRIRFGFFGRTLMNKSTKIWCIGDEARIWTTFRHTTPKKAPK